MELNTQVWGDNTEWQVDETINYYDDGKKAYNGKYKSLSDYVTNNIFELNTAIDNTILYCGQAAGVTPWGDRAIYSGFDSLEGTTPTPTLEINRQADIALFTVQNNTSHFRGIDGIRAIMNESTNPDSLTNTGYTRWSPYARNFPDAEYPNTNLPNTNYQLCPVVDFDLRCMIGVIYVDVCSTIDGTRSTMTLYDFEHGNYSDYVILYAFMRLALLSGTDSYSIVQTSSPSRAIGFVDMRPIETATGDYINYVESVENVPSIPLFGFNEDRYSWNSTYRCFNTYWGYNNGDTEYTNTMSHAGVLYSASRATFVHYKIQKDYQTYSGLYNVWYYMENNADNLEYLRKAAAAYGIWFTDNPTSDILLSPTRWTDNNMMLGLLRDGIGYGDYTRGVGNTDNPAYNWSSSHDSGYDPSAGHDPNTYSTETVFNTVGNVAATTKQYVLNGTGVQALTSELWSCLADLLTDPSDISNLDNLCYDTFLTNNPIDCLISLKKFPLSSVPHGSTLENLKLGKYTASTAGYPLSGTQYEYMFAPIDIFARLGNSFLDYQPYTNMQLYVPFCGTIDIDPADFMGRRLTVRMVIDFITGACTAYVQSGGLVVQTLTGSCAVDLAITGTEQATVSAAIENNVVNERQSRIKNIMGVVGMLSHPVKSITKPLTTEASRVSNALTEAKAIYDLEHTQIPLRVIGSASPLNSWALEFTIRLLIYYPDGSVITFTGNNEPSLNDDKITEFGTLYGFACCETGTLSQYSGFTQCSEVNMSNISATDTEKEMILKLLNSGVYL